MANAPNNPENGRLSYFVKDYPIIVEIYNGDSLVRTENMNYSNYEDKKWLGRLSFWAWTEGYTVETRPKEIGQ